MGVKFSVVTVTYNAENVLRRTIESVLNQEYTPFEYIVIDGVSSDKTVEIANEYNELFSEKGVHYTVISEKDSGIYNAMNKGIKLAQGDFISFLNAGDWYELDALKNVNDFYSEDSFELTYGGLHYIKPDGTVLDKMSKFDTGLVTSRHWNHPSMFLRASKYKKYFFDENFPAYADFNLYLKLRKDGTKIRVIDKIITNFVADGVSTNTSFKKVLARSKEKYTAYVRSGYSRIYWFESYGWEILKSVYLKLHS